MLVLQIDEKWKVITYFDTFVHGDIELYRHGELLNTAPLDNVHRATLHELYKARTAISCIKQLAEAIPSNIPS